MFFEELLRFILLALVFGGFFSLGARAWYWIDNMHLIKMIGGYFGNVDWAYLRIFPPVDNKTSIGEMENFFVSLCGQYYLKDPIDLYVHGTYYDMWSFEYHSIGGKIGIFVRMNRKRVSFFRSIIEARFPGTRIVESPDPLGGLPKEWKGKAGPYTQYQGCELDEVGGEEMIGTERGQNNDVFPLKSWKDFQRDMDAPIGDPLHQLFSALEGVPSDVHVVIQWIFIPFGSNDIFAKVKERWKEQLQLIKDSFASGNKLKTNDEEGNMMLMFVEQEKKILDDIIRKIGSQILHTKIRVGILSDKTPARPIFDEVFGYFKQFSTDIVMLYPEKICRTWAVYDAGSRLDGGAVGSWVGTIANEIFWNRQQKYQEKWLYKGMIGRGYDFGLTPKYYSAESLAAMFHFPITIGEDDTRSIFSSRISSGYGNENAISVAGKPPSNLPG